MERKHKMSMAVRRKSVLLLAVLALTGSLLPAQAYFDHFRNTCSPLMISLAGM